MAEKQQQKLQPPVMHKTMSGQQAGDTPMDSGIIEGGGRYIPEDNSIERSAMGQLLDTLGEIVQGGSMLPLTQCIAKVLPKDKDDAFVFLEEVRRLKMASERAYTIAQEAYWASGHK